MELMRSRVKRSYPQFSDQLISDIANERIRMRGRTGEIERESQNYATAYTEVLTTVTSILNLLAIDRTQEIIPSIRREIIRIRPYTEAFESRQELFTEQALTTFYNLLTQLNDELRARAPVVDAPATERAAVNAPAPEQQSFTFETDINKATQSPEIEPSPDSITGEHIQNYYYRCKNELGKKHVYKMETMRDYCINGIHHGRNCSVCSVCRSPMNAKLYRQPQILDDIYETLFEKVLTDGDLYDEQRIRKTAELIDLLATMNLHDLDLLINTCRNTP